MLGEAAAPYPCRVLHASHAQALRPCLAATQSWPLSASCGLPSYRARAADRLPGREAPISSSILATNESLCSSDHIDRVLLPGSPIRGARDAFLWLGIWESREHEGLGLS